MLSYITGTLEEINTMSIVVDNRGIGYEINVPGSIIPQLPNIKETVKIYTLFIPREDEFFIYGFLSKEELAVFKLLLTVNSVGPKGALSILTELSVDDLRFAIASDDYKKIQAANGIGAKTAQKVCLELKDKIDIVSAYEGLLNAGSKKSSAASSAKQEVVLALTSMGYSASDVAKVLDTMTISDSVTTEQLLKDTLKQMAFM